MARAMLAEDGNPAGLRRRVVSAIVPAAVPAPVVVPVPALPAPPAAAPGLSWDAYKASIGDRWNLSDQVNGFAALGRTIGYTGPVQERTGRQVIAFEGESGPVYADEWAPAPGLEAALRGYRFQASQDGDRNPTVNVTNQAGALVSSNRIGSSPGSAFKVASVIIPALVGAGFASGIMAALGPLFGPAGAVVEPAAGLAADAAPAQFVFNAAVDSQAASAALGISGAEAAAAAIVPAAVDLGTLGGIVSTAAPTFAETVVQTLAEVFTPATPPPAAPAGLVADAAPAFTFNAAVDSQAASAALGISGADAAAAAIVPPFVNLGTLGGIVSTAAPAVVPAWAGALGDAAVAVVKPVLTSAAVRELTNALTPGADSQTMRPIAPPPTYTTTGQAGAPGAGLLALLLAAGALLLN